MSGGNGSETYFQTKMYGGENLRDLKTRPQLSPIEQLIINAIREIKDDIKEIKVCKDDCNLGEFRPHVGHGVSIIKEKGNGNIEQGLNNFRDESKEIGKALSTKEKTKDWAIKALVGVLIMYFAVKMGWV